MLGDLLIIPDVLDDEACSRIVNEMNAGTGRPGEVYGRGSEGTIDTRVRLVDRVTMAPLLVAEITERLVATKPELERHFGTAPTILEPVQFLRYEPGGYFVAHQDGNTSLIHDESRFRRFSIVVFLNDRCEKDIPGTYDGGALMLHGSYPDHDLREPVEGKRGSMAAFRSETTHEVTPVTRGRRYTVVSWFRVAD